MTDIRTDIYFAALGQPAEEGQEPDSTPAEYVAALNQKVSDYYTFYGSSGLFERDKRAYLTTYGISPDGDSVTYKPVLGGENGQLVKISVNHFGNIIQHRKSLVTAKRPALDARATNSDSKSLEQTSLANDVLEHFTRALGMEAKTRDMVSTADAQREAWLWTKWNANGGDLYADDATGQQKKTGCLETQMLLGQDVIRDVGTIGGKFSPWVIVRDFVNKFDLIARFPEKEQEILAIPSDESMQLRVEFQPWVKNTDMVPVYRFYHERTDALPQGRQTTFFTGGTEPLLDGPLKYGGKIPVLQLSPQRMLGTPFGHTPMHDLLGLQAIYDALISGIATNELTFAVKRLLKPRGQPLGARALTQDLALLEYDQSKEKPSMLEVDLQTNERLEALGMIEQLMQTLSGINDVVRGNVGKGETKAASGLALIQNQALQFLSGLEFEYADFWRRWGELTLAILRERATAPLMISIVGEGEQETLKSFKGEDLANEYRVTVDLGDSMARTAAGMQQRADALLAGGFLGQGPEALPRYFEVSKTGTLEPIVNEVTSEDDLINAENDAILRGEVPPVSEYDTPEKHMARHAIVAFNPSFRTELKASDSAPKDVQTGLSSMPSKRKAALDQHMLMHRMMQQKMASIQNAQAAALAQMQAMQAPVMPPPGGAPPGGSQGPSQGSPPPGHAPQQSNPSDTPGIREAKPAQPPASAAPMPGVG